MPSLIQRSFAAGEISPALAARADQSKYATGLKTCRNFRVMRHGGVENRPGLGYIAEQKDSAARGRLHKFVYNADQTYLLIFEDQTLRFVQNGARLAVSGVAAYSGATAYVQGDLVLQGGVHYYAKQATTGNAPPNATYWHPLTGSIYEIPTPYATADLPQLKFDQSGDVVTITHHSYDTRELRRTGTTAWTLTEPTIGPQQVAPTSPTNTGPGAGTAASWVVTALNSETLEESVPTSATTSSAAPTSGSPITVNWTDAAGASQYNVYRATINGVHGFVGVAAAGVAGFLDNGIIPDTSATPPQARDPFVAADDRPSTSGYWQQRHLFGNTNNAIEKIFASKSGSFKNFSTSSPLQDDDAVTFTVAGNQVQEVRHILSLGELIILTAGGEWVIKGDQDGVLRPAAINPVQQGYNGAAWVNPAIVGNNAIYVQARGSIVRDLRYDLQTNGYSGRDLSVFSAHLFDGHQIGNGTAGFDYQQVPHSIVHAIRDDDGVLLGLTYLREHEIAGWHRHDTQGYFEDVCCVPEGEEDAAYVLVRRTVNHQTKRYIERFYSRRVTDVAVDAKFVDCGLTYDGRNAGATTMTLSGGTTWAHTETLTLESSADYFSAGDVGNAIVIWEDVVTNEGLESETTTRERITVTITGYTGLREVTGRANRAVPNLFRSGARTTWGKAVDDISGLDHLEGKRLSILGDGNVIANGWDEPFFTVSAGAVHLPRPYMVIHAGLPYLSDFETLDLEVLNGETLADKLKLVKGVTLLVLESRGIWAGPNFDRRYDADGVDVGDNLVEFRQRNAEDWGEPIALLTGKAEIAIISSWGDTAHVCVRQRDPLPLTILAAVPFGDVQA